MIRTATKPCIYCAAFERVLHSDVAHIYLMLVERSFEKRVEVEVYECAGCRCQWRHHRDSTMKWSRVERAVVEYAMGQ